jgi:hypothetical protein
MSPLLKNNDYVLTKKIENIDKLYLGEIVEISHPNLGIIIKKIIDIKEDKILVSGLSKTSIEPYSIGWVNRVYLKSRLIIGITSKKGILFNKQVND